MAKRKKSSRGAARSPAVKTGGAKASAARRSERPDPTLLGVWLLILLPPLVFVPGLTDNFRLPKLMLTEVLGLVSLLLLSWRLRAAGRVDPWTVLRHPAVLAVLPTVLVVTVGSLLSDHPEITRRALPSLWIGGACLVGWSLALSNVERHRLLRGLLWPASVLAAFAVLQFHGLFDPFQFQDKVTDRIRLTSLAGGAFDLSGYLVLPMLIAQASWARAGRRGRLAIGAFLMLGLWASVASRTVTALVALAVGSLLLWRRRLPARRLAAAAALTAAVLAVLVTIGPLGKRAGDLAESFSKGEVNRLLTGRLDAWRGALWMLRENPWVGVGHGAFRAEYGQARLALTAEGVEFFRGQRQVYFTNAHSDLLNAIAEWGLLGMAAAIASLVLLLRLRGRRPPERDGCEANGEAKPEHLGAACAAALAILALTYFPLHLGLIAYPWLLLGSGWLAADRRRPSDEDGAGSKLPARTLAALLAVLLLVATFWRIRGAQDLVGASRLLAVVEASTLQAARAGGSVPPGLLRRNLEWLRKAGDMDPAEVGVPLAEGGQYYLMRRFEAAQRAYGRALELETRGEIYANLARCHLAANDRPAAMEALERAFILDHTQRRAFRDVLRQEQQRQQIKSRRSGDDGV